MAKSLLVTKLLMKLVFLVLVVLFFFVSVGVVVESPETQNTHIISPTTAGIPPVVIPGISTRS